MNGTRTGSFAQHLEQKLGPAAAAPPELLARLTADRHTDTYAGVLAPPDAAGIAAALELCSAEGWPVRAAGAGTWLTREPAAAARQPVLISTARLTRIVEHEPADLVVGVQAGMPVQQVAAALAAQGQWLPLDPAAAPEATIGAVASLGSAGPLRAGNGTPRDMVLGVELATGDGRLLRFGGRVVKNVAGYDGVRMAIGSVGTIGIITSLYVRVRGTPRADRTLACGCGAGPAGAARGAELALAVRERVGCDALELVSPEVAARLGGVAEPAQWTLLVRLLGSDAAVEEATDRVERFTAGPGSPRAAASWRKVPGSVWSQLARAEAEAGAALRLTGPATALAAGLTLASRFIDAGYAKSDNAGATWLCAAHAADGVIRVWSPADAAQSGAVPSINPDDGWTVRYDRSFATPAQSGGVAELTRRVRAAFDPAGILRP